MGSKDKILRCKLIYWDAKGKILRCKENIGMQSMILSCKVINWMQNYRLGCKFMIALLICINKVEMVGYNQWISSFNTG